MTTIVHKNNQPFFPIGSDYMSWEDWNGNFIIYYGQENVPFTSEEEWKITANVIAGSATFSVFPIPLPDKFEAWQDWAQAVTQSINGKSH